MDLPAGILPSPGSGWLGWALRQLDTSEAHHVTTRPAFTQAPYHKSQAIYLESKENTKISCVISSVGANEIWVRKTSDSTKMRIYLGQLQRGAFVIRRRSAA
ncbi:UNVERIFIED_CONTAM: hypothetical protein K2H54_025239 [Gekko kuhli]